VALAAALYVVPNGAGVNQDLVPNSKLRPEQVKSYEAGIRGQFSRGYFRRPCSRPATPTSSRILCRSRAGPSRVAPITPS